MKLAVFAISMLWIVFIIYFACLKLQLRSLRRQLEYRISAPEKKPLALEMQDSDLTAMTAALNQIFRQDEEFRRNQHLNENEYKELITNISHDLRTPLTVLKGYMQLLERCEIDDAGREYLSVCFRHADELERRIRQFFEYSYWMNQEQEPELKILNITNLVVDTMTDFIPMFEEKGLTMRLEQDAVCKGWAEEELLRRVMQNLLKNCLHYSSGEVVVSVSQDTDGFMCAPPSNEPAPKDISSHESRASKSNSTHESRVSKDNSSRENRASKNNSSRESRASKDNSSRESRRTDMRTCPPGPLPHGNCIRICAQNPIPEDSEPDPAKMFQRFYVERKERNQSTGLGLSIVKLLVEKMHGEVFAIRDENILSIGFYLRSCKADTKFPRYPR